MVLKNDTLKIEDEKELKISDTILKATLDIEKQNLDISSLKSNINYQEISSKLEAKANLKEFDIEKDFASSQAIKQAAENYRSAIKEKFPQWFAWSK